MSPNARVEESLVAMGINHQKILRSTYGWSPAKFNFNQEPPRKTTFRLLFIGNDAIRKGAPQLLAAWKKSQVVGELLIVGGIDAPLRPILAPYLESDSVRLVGYRRDLAELYRSADAFVIPSLEEGDPLVTYQAASFGLPIIATPMGSANIVKHGINGLLVSPHDVDGLANAIACLASSPDLQARMGSQAAKDAQGYTFEKIGKHRARMLRDVLSRRGGSSCSAS
jgi:glycosyltransferase involved in cell wall biosynthesis